jgi:crotonobetainyl-CoA:carnitine CoA-transferase CaiB-like acyl-CoA transferase
LFEVVDTPCGELTIPAILPRLSATPGKTDWPGGAVGTHTDAILLDIGFSQERLDELRANGEI